MKRLKTKKRKGKKNLLGFAYDKTPNSEEKRKRKMEEDTTEEVQESKVIDVEDLEEQPTKRRR